MYNAPVIRFLWSTLQPLALRLAHRVILHLEGIDVFLALQQRLIACPGNGLDGVDAQYGVWAENVEDRGTDQASLWRCSGSYVPLASARLR